MKGSITHIHSTVLTARNLCLCFLEGCHLKRVSFNRRTTDQVLAELYDQSDPCILANIFIPEYFCVYMFRKDFYMYVGSVLLNDTCRIVILKCILSSDNVD